jgi:drug/metabolite transporter (DMT)-like permease
VALTVIATIAALVGAALYAASTALLHRSAGLVAEATSGGGLGKFVASTSVHPLWLLGMLGQLSGFGLHALALRDGPLTLVQPLMVTEVVFALPLRHLLEGRRPRNSELLWAGVLCAGLATFLVVATPAEGPTRSPDPLPTIVTVVALGGGVALCTLLGRGARGNWAAAVLAVGAGLGFAGTAGALKQVTDQLSHGLGSVVLSWPLYAVGAGGAVGMLLTQLAFRAGPLRASLPTMATVDTVASLIIGVVVFDEPFRVSPFALFGEVTGLVVVVVGLALLTSGDGDGRDAHDGSEGRSAELVGRDVA